MSDADASSKVAVAAEGITVRKAIATEEFPVPAVTFEFTSERDDAAVVRLVDASPDDVALDDIGFNPDYGGDYWGIEDGYAVFERRLAPGEEYRTVYGVRNADLDPNQFTIDPVLDVTGVDTPETDHDDTEAFEEVTTATAAGANGVGAALATELRNDDLSPSDHELIAETFGRQDVDEVRLSHLQSRISDLEAYSDALETFIDDHGAGHEAVEDFSDRLDTIENEVDDLADRIDENAVDIETVTEDTEENASDIDDIDERLDETTTEIDGLADRTDENAADIDALDKGVADVQAEIEETQAWVDDLRGDIEESEAWRSRISSVFGEGSLTEGESKD